MHYLGCQQTEVTIPDKVVQDKSELMRKLLDKHVPVDASQPELTEKKEGGDSVKSSNGKPGKKKGTSSSWKMETSRLKDIPQTSAYRGSN